MRMGLFIIMLLASMVLSGCSTDPAETIYNHLEKAVAMEDVFEQQQQPLVDAEQREHQLYEEIISLGVEEFEEIRSLAEEALTIVEQRQGYIEKEKESLDASFEEFLKVETEIESIDNQDVRSSADELVEVMNKRYDKYQELYHEYENAIDLDRELYEMLQDEELTIDVLQEQIDLINTSYQSVSELKETFNQYTESYNQHKKDFYEAAELDVSYPSE
ncbi:YkyA family protein [Desertibacillus haloalkaliphilus]|uniref:YkyA family protein n=1 Tax=Desertibacillus haloalkaliphilus TaxID=1328930 RepID=UPI001C261964|nr:YkyA family protein [Desertibacillus haloalkaliphilus]MBU8906756.1 YkyA family protein [Desertibacillus haloalkaliphilus]